eukprot:2144485-Alexandrium_andersonii.AAC.1
MVKSARRLKEKPAARRSSRALATMTALQGRWPLLPRKAIPGRRRSRGRRRPRPTPPRTDSGGRPNRSRPAASWRRP